MSHEGFQISDVEASLGQIEVVDGGSALRIRPVRSARWQGPVMVAGSVLLLLLGITWSTGEQGGTGSFAFALAFVAALAGVRIMRASVVLDRERVVSRNVWATSWISGSSVKVIRVEERGRGSLWSWGVDASFPPNWVPLDVVIVEGGGRRIVADALRSDRRVHLDGHPATTVARVRADVMNRWRSTWWTENRAAPADPIAP